MAHLELAARLPATMPQTGRWLARIWPPAGLILGLVATVAWNGFLAVKVLGLLGLAL